MKGVSSLSAFTLLELIIVITIIGIVSVSSYFPYAFYQKKVLVKQAAKEISQSLLEVRNMALNGYNSWSGNTHTALFISSWATELEYYAYPYQQSIDPNNLNENYRIKKKVLPKGIYVESIAWESRDTVFSFTAISGSGSIVWPTNIGESVSIIVNGIWSRTDVLQKELLYYTRSYISDTN